MIPVYVMTAGLFLGILATSNLTAGIVCGGMFGLIAWALSGFRINHGRSTNPANIATGDIVSIDSKTSQELKGRFHFADGATCSAEEYGYIAVRTASQNALAITDSCFGEDSTGGSLGLSQAIQKVRFSADIYTTMLGVGVYIWYAASVLKVSGSVIERISKGVRDCLGDMRAPNGSVFDSEFKDHLLALAHNFSEEVEKDVKKTSSSPPDEYRSQSLTSAALLFDVLIRSNSTDKSVREMWRKELDTPVGWLVRHMVEDSTLANMLALRKQLNVHYES